MNAKAIKHQHRLQTWAPVIRDCKNSGVTVKAWCEENSVNEKQFYYWQRRVREEVLGQMVIANTTKDQNPTFVQLPDVPKQKKTFMPDMILNCGNYSLELSNTISPELLSMVIKVISHAE